MNLSSKLYIPISLCLLLCSLNAQAQQQKHLNNKGPAYVNFNLGESPVANPKRQEVSFYGCNTEVSTRDVSWNNQKNLEWNAKNQVMSGLPYGPQKRDGKDYYVSKYYMASPPAFDVFNEGGTVADSVAIIGLVIPDQFTFFGERPVQQVYLDYKILEPVYLNFINVDYQYVDAEGRLSAHDLGVDLVPLNIQCKDFRWLNQGDTYEIRNARGASGIARLRNNAQDSKVFLPSYKPNGEDCLECEITILDDILIDHEVFFVHKGNLVKKLNLTEFYKLYGNTKSIPLFSLPRIELPEGCKEPGK